MLILRDENLINILNQSNNKLMFEQEEVTDYPDYLFLTITTKHAKYILY